MELSRHMCASQHGDLYHEMEIRHSLPRVEDSHRCMPPCACGFVHDRNKKTGLLAVPMQGLLGA